jgi:uncharacterized membrane protein YheB (UPF0754 family)
MEFLQTIVSNPNLAAFLSMPFIYGLVGWVTNIIAIKMMFEPLEFFGIPPYLGWQGIIPSRIAEMATTTVKLITTKLISVKDVFSQLDPARVAEEMEESFLSIIEPMVEDMMMSYSPKLWESIPLRIKKRIIDSSKRDIPKVTEKIMADIRDNIERLFDLNKLVVDALVQNKSLMNEIFLKCGSKEFKFIGHSGFFFGFLFGIIQMVIWFFFQHWWLLPLGGLIVGYATNWVALRMIFEPKNPIKIGPFVIHGLFFKRQTEVAEEYSEIISREILYARNIMDAIFQGPMTDEVIKIVQNHTKRSLEKNLGLGKPFVLMVIGTDSYLEMKKRVCEMVLEQMPKSLNAIEEYTEEAIDIKNLLREKMTELSPEDYEGILRPAFQHDEWKLIVAGATLGLCAGFGQLVFMFRDVM